jgi:hypothetical protein
MKIEKSVARKIVKDSLISVLIYALPVLLMFAYFLYTGQRPWVKKDGLVNQVTIAKTSTFKK